MLARIGSRFGLPIETDCEIGDTVAFGARSVYSGRDSLLPAEKRRNTSFGSCAVRLKAGSQSRYFLVPVFGCSWPCTLIIAMEVAVVSAPRTPALPRHVMPNRS